MSSANQLSLYNYWDRIKTPLEEYAKKTSLKDSSTGSYSPLSAPISIPITTSDVTNLINSSSGGTGLTPNLNHSGNGNNYNHNNHHSTAINIPNLNPHSTTNLAPIPSMPIPILRQSQMISAITPSSYSPLPGIISNKIAVPLEVSEYIQHQQQLNHFNGVDSNNNNIILTNHIGNSSQFLNSSDNIMSPFFGGGLSSSNNNSPNISNNQFSSPNINISQSYGKPPIPFGQYIQQSLLAQSLQQSQQNPHLTSSQINSPQIQQSTSNNSPNLLNNTGRHLFRHSRSLSYSNSMKGSLSPTINFTPGVNRVYYDGADVIPITNNDKNFVNNTTAQEITPESSDEDNKTSNIVGDPNSIEMKTIHNDTSYGLPSVDQHVIDIKAKKKKKRGSKYLQEGGEKIKRFSNSVYQILVPDSHVPVHVVDEIEMENTVLPFLMELGRALLMSGVPAHRLEFELTLVSSTFGIDGHFFSTPTGIFFSFGSPHTILSPYTHFLRIHGMDYNMNRMVLLEELADLVIYGKIDCKEGLIRLKNILKAKPLYNDYLMVFSFLLSSFAISFFFKAGWVEVGACSLVGLYVGLLYLAAGKWSTVGRILEALSAFGGAILASLFNAYIYPVHIFMVSLAGIIALAPGLSLTVAVAEISTRNLISGNARLMGVFSCLLQLTFGIALGTKVSSNILPLQTEVSPASFPSWTMFLAIPLAAVSFAVQMKVHPRQIWVITLASVLGIVCGNWGNKFFGNDVGSFFGSMGICILGNLYARFANTTSAVPIMSGILLLVPGSMGVRGLFQVSLGDINGGIQFFGGMFMIAISLTMGLLIANLIIKPNKTL